MQFTYRSQLGSQMDSQLGANTSSSQGAPFRAFDPQQNSHFGETFYSASLADVAQAGQLAQAAFYSYATTSNKQRSDFLRQIAANIEQAAALFLEYTCRETGLSAARVSNETARCIQQFNLFAAALDEGSWVNARIDQADPQRQPMPKPDVRSMAVALGPVAVFGASNFPLAFSVVGVDTVAALAAGCPVIVKAHAAHPHTSEIAAQTIIAAINSCQLPAGIFSHLLDQGTEIGRALVLNPAVKAVGFTGSLRAGRALFDLASQRPEPIPVYAEMGSVNPQLILPHAMQNRANALADGLAASVTTGVGQLCTCPGLVFAVNDAHYSAFKNQLIAKLSQQAPAAMLAPGIAQGFSHNWQQQAQVATRLIDSSQQGCLTSPGLLECRYADYQQQPALHEEAFGPSTILVQLDRAEQFAEVLEQLSGQLAISLHLDDADTDLARQLLRIAPHKAGRVQVNGFPTGVEVCHAMVHGGPYPACTDARATSVGTAAMERFLRRVAFQSLPDELLPAALQTNNPQRIRRLVDGVWS